MARQMMSEGWPIQSNKGIAIATMNLLAGATFNSPPVALFVTNFRSRSDCALSVIAECCGLTRAETPTHHFMEGGTVAETAHALAVSEYL